MKTDPLHASQPPNSSSGTPDLHDAIRRRAEEIYIRNGRIPGRDLENWAQAEQEIRGEAEESKRRTAIVVKVNGVQYIGEYRAELSDGYQPGEFGPGTPVSLRLEGNRMFLKRPNGKVLETEVVQKIG